MRREKVFLFGERAKPSPRDHTSVPGRKTRVRPFHAAAPPKLTATRQHGDIHGTHLQHVEPTVRSAHSHAPHFHPTPPHPPRWVREELHRWVYDNVRAKWTFVLRKPSRLPELFTGYHASRALVADVLRR